MSTTALAERPQQVPPRASLIEKLAARFHVEPGKMMTTLKATAFKVKNGEATNEQMMALLVVADQYGLNPWTREIFAFPDKQNGIVPVVGVDGWSRIINDNPAFDGMEFVAAEEINDIDEHAKPCPEWMECVIYRKDRQHPIRVREYLDEVYRPPFKGQSGLIMGPWQSHTKRFLRHKVMIQCARLAFGFVGIYDEDEAHRIIERDITADAHIVEQKSGSRTQAVKDKLKQRTEGQADATDTETGETESLLDAVKRHCAAALEIEDNDTALLKLDDAKVLLQEMNPANRKTAEAEIAGTVATINDRK